MSCSTESSPTVPNNQSLVKPDFFIVGAAKAGTTSLYHYLASHPDVYMSPVKEPHFFATDIVMENLGEKVKRDLKQQDTEKFISDGMQGTLHRAYIRDRELYQKLFANAQAAKITGEASPSYLYSATAATAIFAYNPAAKIIIILRNPAERAYSHYLMDRRIGFTNDGFATALNKDGQSPYKTWGASSNYIELGMYYEQVKRYFEIFPKNQIFVLLQEDLKKDPLVMMKALFRFLVISEQHLPNFSKKHNEAVVPRYPFVSRILESKIYSWIGASMKNNPMKQQIKKIFFKEPDYEMKDNEVIRKLKLLYQHDIEKLSVLLNRDLSLWK